MKKIRLTVIILTLLLIGGYFSYRVLNHSSAYSATAVAHSSSRIGIPENEKHTRSYFITSNRLGSQETIDKAINDYALDELFGIDKKQLSEHISRTLKVTQYDATDPIKILVSGKSKEQAQQILYAVMTSFEERRRESTGTRRREVIQKFKQKLKAQEDKVEDHRVRLFKLSKAIGIPYNGVDTKFNLSKEPNKRVHKFEKPPFTRAQDDYERELMILKKIKEADFLEQIVTNFKIDPIQYHKRGWSPEVEAFMKARKQK